MKNVLKRFARLGLALTLTAGMTMAAAQVEAGKTFNVGVCQLVEHGALDAANRGFVDGLAKAGFKEGVNLKIDQQNAQADQSNLANIAHRFISNRVDLVCAIATPAAQTIANATDEIPIVGTAITDYVVAKLAKTNEKPGANVTGTTDMNPVEEQLKMLMKFVPNMKTVGTIYSSSEVNSQLQVEILKAAAAKCGLQVKEATVSTVNDIQQAARSLVGKVEGIYIPTDNVLASAVPTLLSITDEEKIPVVAGEGSFVEAGCLGSLGIDYYTLGVQTGMMAADILKGKAQPATMAIQGQKECAAVVNAKALKTLGLKLPKEFKNAKMVG
ncbi:MAG: ABC transporter substrate-binding protein [Acidaminococcaceae bacterium]|nr:ABC transporter substrate-binding protein [Acidaminococcaceae bacterium]